MKNKTKAWKVNTLWLTIALLMVHTASAQMPFACFCDGEVFHANGTPVKNGVNVQIINIDTGETRNTTTGYPNYPPIEEYNNDYKSVFTCVAGADRVSVKAWDETNYGYGEMIIPRDSQALLNITLDKPIEKQGWSIRMLIGKVIRYFMV